MFSDASWLQPFLMCSCLSFGGVYGNAVTLLQRLSIRPAAPELQYGRARALAKILLPELAMGVPGMCAPKWGKSAASAATAPQGRRFRKNFFQRGV